MSTNGTTGQGAADTEIAIIIGSLRRSARSRDIARHVISYLPQGWRGSVVETTICGPGGAGPSARRLGVQGDLGVRLVGDAVVQVAAHDLNRPQPHDMAEEL